MLLLRAVVAPLILAAAVVLAFGAALGTSALIFRHVLDFAGADSSLPLFVFVSLVALGPHSCGRSTMVPGSWLVRGCAPRFIDRLVGGIAADAIGCAFRRLPQQDRPDLMRTEGTAPMKPESPYDADISPEIGQLDQADRPDGPGAAMVVSAGIAIFVLGFLTVLAEASAGANTWLMSWQWGRGVGTLAGKSTIASLVYVGSLALLWTLWRNKDVNIKTAFYVGLTLGILGAIGTFPKFFQMFAA